MHSLKIKLVSLLSDALESNENAKDQLVILMSDLKNLNISFQGTPMAGDADIVASLSRIDLKLKTLKVSMSDTRSRLLFMSSLLQDSLISTGEVQDQNMFNKVYEEINVLSSNINNHHEQLRKIVDGLDSLRNCSNIRN